LASDPSIQILDEEVKKGEHQLLGQGSGINSADEQGEYENAVSIAANQKDQMFTIGLEE
jgi:hypothetical protein